MGPNNYFKLKKEKVFGGPREDYKSIPLISQPCKLFFLFCVAAIGLIFDGHTKERKKKRWLAGRRSSISFFLLNSSSGDQFLFLFINDRHWEEELIKRKIKEILTSSSPSTLLLTFDTVSDPSLASWPNGFLSLRSSKREN